MPRPKPPELLKSRFIRLSDTEWETFKSLGGADWLRKFMRTKPLKYNEVFQPVESVYAKTSQTSKSSKSP